MIKVSIDSGPLTSGHSVRGVGAYTRELIRALERETRLRKATARQGLKIEAVDFEKVDLSTYDLMHFTYFNPFFLTLPFNKPAKTIVTIHDTIPLIYPNQYPPGIRGLFKFKIQKFLLNKVDGIITPSETSKKDVVRFLGVPAGKIRVIYEAPREVFRRLEIRDQSLVGIRKKYNLPSSFVLYVGDVNYNKNILGLADSCKIAKIPLVIVGKQAVSIDVDFAHLENQPFKHFLEKYGKDTSILRLGYVLDEDLVALYNLASVYCQPSFYEGFGLSVLEAMACGLPVVCSKTQALVEIAEDAALFADPKKPEDLARAITKILKNKKTKKLFVKKGFERAKMFSWVKTARETIDFYKSVYGE